MGGLGWKVQGEPFQSGGATWGQVRRDTVREAVGEGMGYVN